MVLAMKKFFGMLLGAALCLPAWAGVQIQQWVAPTGARVLFVESRVLPIVDIQVDFAAGSAYDPADKVGLAAFTKGLLDAGAGELDEEALAGKLADTGAQLGGVMDADRAGLSLRTLSSSKERQAAVELMRLILSRPTFPTTPLERERERAIAAIREAETQPASVAAKRFSASVYPAHPYGYVATEVAARRITREDLIEFHRKHYAAGRAVVSIVGDLSRAEAETLAMQLTEGLPKGPGDGTVASVTLPPAATVRVAHPSTQAHVYLGTPGLKRIDPDYYPLVVGNYILGGGGFVSRLMKSVREQRGLAYSVHSYFMPQKELGAFQIGLQTKVDQADEALAVVNATLREFLDKGPSAAELQAAKRNIIDGFVLRIDSNRKLLDHVAVIGFYGLPLSYLEDYPRHVAAVSAVQIRDAFARRLRAEHMVTVVVGGKNGEGARAP